MLRYNTILLTRDVSGTVTSIWLVFDFQPETPVFKTELQCICQRGAPQHSCLLARCGNTLQESHVGRLGSTPVGRPSDQPPVEPPALSGPALTPVARVRVAR